MFNKLPFKLPGQLRLGLLVLALLVVTGQVTALEHDHDHAQEPYCEFPVHANSTPLVETHLYTFQLISVGPRLDNNFQVSVPGGVFFTSYQSRAPPHPYEK